MPIGVVGESIIINHENITRYECQHKGDINISTVDEKIPALSVEKTSHNEENIWKFAV